ncbi:DNA ligase D [Alteribacter lacisalsi]|uniref:DNA ligase D n=1 Tax=Alteribacter lacisalsi TaxID=2045244 RepID=A0A2W0HBT0_9BACI|nr:DNA ligase D [Alteribacter lacisalsi]PYZ98321.1 DNA ligase D [Alteribacter lacisalsi]
MMLPTRRDTWPDNDGRWVYEVKYDGFRAVLTCSLSKITLTSRNGKDLSSQFPEVIQFLHSCKERLRSFMPLKLDGELVFLKTPWSSDFSVCQKRGRMRSDQSATRHAQEFRAFFTAFDLLKIKGKEITGRAYENRKHIMAQLFFRMGWPKEPDPRHDIPVQYVPHTENPDRLWSSVTANQGEGIVAKDRKSRWVPERSDRWIKVKNYRNVMVLITGEKANGYFTVGNLQNGRMAQLGSFLHGMSSSEKDALKAIIRKNGRKEQKEIRLPDPVPVSLLCIGCEKNELREPRFASFLLGSSADDKTFTERHLAYDLHPLPDEQPFTNLDKPMYPDLAFTKRDFLLYLQKAAPNLLYWLSGRPLTVIRFPDGVEGKSFYQKNAPNQAPSFVRTIQWEGQNAVVADSLNTLLWLGNQACLEFHIPPENEAGEICEMFLDLDPPDRSAFSMAKEAALDLKEIFDRFELASFVKTSGRKGLQVYLPFTPGSFSYSECRIFLKFCAEYLAQKDPAKRTLERRITKREGKMYIDYLQHGKGKTIIAPFSMRAVAEGACAVPLTWKEAERLQSPSELTFQYVTDRYPLLFKPVSNEEAAANTNTIRKMLKKIGKTV